MVIGLFGVVEMQIGIMASLSEDEKRRESFRNVSSALEIQLLTSLGNRHFL